jgi:hypothetical protein
MVGVRFFCVGMGSDHGESHVIVLFMFDLDEEDEVPITQTPKKVLKKEKQPHVLLESTHLNTMATNYNQHFT